MTRAEIKTTFDRILQEQAGMPVSINPLGDDCTLEEDLGLTSLDMASLQLALEDTFGLKFAENAKSFTDIDRAWDAMKTVKDGIELVEVFLEKK